MPYPFAQSPTFAEFKADLEQKFGCKFEKEEMLKNDELYTILYIERIVEGNPIQCSIDHYKDEDRVILADVRSICERLEIDPKVFGLVLG